MSNATGIDVSGNNGPFDWHAHPDIAFAGAKCVEGPHDGEGFFFDPDFAANWQAMREVYGNKLVRIAYLFLHPAHDPVEQADALTSVAREHGLQYGDVLAVDLEPYPGLATPDGMAPADVARAMRACCARINRNCPDLRCLAYLSPSTAELGCAAGCEGWGLWLADYNPAPQVPAPWRRYRAWQRSGTGLDLDEWDGDRQALRDFVRMPADRR